MAGRPPKPAATRRAEGNPGKRPIPDVPEAPTPAAVAAYVATILPPATATGHWVDGGLRAELWDEYASILEPMSLLTTASAHGLVALCEAHAQFIEFTADVDAEGATYRRETDRGGWSLAVNPSVQAAADAWRRWHAGLSSFGLTPSSLSKVGAKDAAPTDDFAQFDGPMIAGGARAS